jgi:uncharacterized secreted protein with C-terminal beta-propeller domain
MNKISISHLTLVATAILLSVNSALAKEHKPRTSNNESSVVGHISFASHAVVDIAIQKIGDKKYLYVQHPREEGITVIDISTPTKAKVVGMIPWPDPAVTSQINMMGSVAIITESGVVPAHDRTSLDLVLWDLSNPTSPRVMQKFHGVLRWLEDEQNFIYVLNGDGLWIVSEPVERQMPTYQFPKPLWC